MTKKLKKLRDFLFVGIAHMVGPELGWQIGRRFLAFAGIGWGGEIQNSGEKELIKLVIGQLKSPVIFDIGAHLGEYSRECLLANPNSCLHMFEPSKAHFDVLKKKLETSCSAGCQCFFVNAGISAKPGTKILFKDDQVTGSASLFRRDLSHLQQTMTIEEECEFLTLHDYIDEHNISHIDLLKIDVEGEEYNIIYNSRALFLHKRISACQFEFGHTNIDSRVNFRDFFRFFNEVDYSLNILLPTGNLYPITKYDERYENYYIANYVAFTNI